MHRLILLGLIGLFLAPGPYGVALNHQTKECGSYWGGDEFINYMLLPGWKEYYPRNGYIETEIGTFPWNGDVESFCREINYTYIPGNMGERRGVRVWTIVTFLYLAINCWPVEAALLVVLTMALVIRRFAPRPAPALTVPAVLPPLMETAGLPPLLEERRKRIAAGQCPKCGSQVTPADKNCPSCRVNLDFVREHFAEW